MSDDENLNVEIGYIGGDDPSPNADQLDPNPEGKGLKRKERTPTIPIQRLRELCKEFEKTHMVVFTYDDLRDAQQVMKYGIDPLRAQQAGNLANDIKQGLNWPDHLTESDDIIERFVDQVNTLEEMCDKYEQDFARLEQENARLREILAQKQ